MAKKNAKKTEHEREGSDPTNLYQPCSTNYLHPEMPTACRIMRGPRAFWCQCPIDRTRQLLAPGRFQEGNGMTLAQVKAAGLVVLG